MNRPITQFVIKVRWDDDERAWIAESSDVPTFKAKAESLWALMLKLSDRVSEIFN